MPGIGSGRHWRRSSEQRGVDFIAYLLRRVERFGGIVDWSPGPTLRVPIHRPVDGRPAGVAQELAVRDAVAIVMHHGMPLARSKASWARLNFDK